MVPWRVGYRMLEEVEASGSGAAGKTWAEEVAEHLPPDTPEEYAVAGGVLLVAVLACVVHRTLFALCVLACCCLEWVLLLLLLLLLLLPPLHRGQGCCAVPEKTRGARAFALPQGCAAGAGRERVYNEKAQAGDGRPADRPRLWIRCSASSPRFHGGKRRG